MAEAARAFAVAFALLVGTTADAEQRFDHRGAVGLLLGGGLEFKEGITASQERDGGLRFPAELGGTYAIGYDGNELLALVRGSFGGPQLDTALIAGYRGYFGAHERFKTFFDLEAAAHFTPSFAVGPRIGFGAQYELSSIVGLYLGAGAQLAFGTGLRFSADLVAGLQFRSYLLE